MNEGIDLIEKDENAFKAFTFMNQSMYYREVLRPTPRIVEEEFLVVSVII